MGGRFEHILMDRLGSIAVKMENGVGGDKIKLEINSRWIPCSVNKQSKRKMFE